MILKVKNLNKIYPSGVQALRDVSFEVEKGEFLVVIGLSGSGKTTLLRCLNRLLAPTSGQIEFHGRRIDGLSGREARAVRRQMALVFQNYNLIPRHTVLSNVLMGRLAHTPTLPSLLGHFPAEDIEKAENYLKLVGMSERAKQRADQLSGGQQQRVALARALCQEPDLLLADEPVASLDPATSTSVMNYLRKANQELGLTIICNLHFLSLVREYATRVIALKNGALVYQGKPSDITEDWFKKIYGEEAREIHVR